jgi:hypothetical protein
MKQFPVFGLVKNMKVSPDQAAKILAETIFYQFKCEYEKGFIKVYFDEIPTHSIH